MKSILVIVFAFVSMIHAQEKTTVCRTSEEVTRALSAAASGDQILLEDGSYRFTAPILIHANGTSAAPIVLKAQHRLKASIIGTTSILLQNSSYVTIEGLVFTNTGSSAIKMEGCHHVRVSRNVFRLDENGRGNWVMITGNNKDTLSLSHHNRIDHNLFENKKELGNFLTVEGTRKAIPVVSQYDVIERNYFRNIGPRVENVLEAIRVGLGEYTLSRGYTLVQDNLFERCDGDPEYISIKESDCTVRHNTFFECLGSLSLRHGNHSTVEGNVVLGNHRTGTFLDSTGKTWTLGTGGVRFCADSMIITGNYFEGLSGTGWDATIAATNGDADYGEGKAVTKHFRITNALINENILADNASGVEIGFDGAGFQGNWWHKAPDHMIFLDNIITGSQPDFITILDKPTRTEAKNNIVFSTGTAVATSLPLPGFHTADPKLHRVNGLLLPQHPTPSQEQLHRLKPEDVGPEAH